MRDHLRATQVDHRQVDDRADQPDRDEFNALIAMNVEPELNKVGLYLINVNITTSTTRPIPPIR